MISIPIPFVVALLLIVMAASNAGRLHETGSGRLFATVLYIGIGSMVLVGLRWTFDLVQVLPLLALASTCSTVLLYLAFSSLGRTDAAVKLSRDAAHLLPVAFIALCVAVQPLLIDATLVVIRLVYAGLLVRLAWAADESLKLVRLTNYATTRQALWAAVLILLLGAVVDASIAYDFANHEGRHAPLLVSVANVVTVLLLGGVAVLSAGVRSEEVRQDNAAERLAPQSDDHASPIPKREHDAEQAALVQQLESLLFEQRLFADPDLNLQRLARKAGVPARDVSRAINAQTGQNLSQWVNTARVAEACRLLKQDGMSITQAMQDAGFVTKSNFNREFRRVKGCNPTQWRQRAV